MDLSTADESWSSVGTSALLCAFFTVIYVFSDFENHQPLFYLFTCLSLFVASVEFGDKILTRVIGEPATDSIRKTASSTSRCLRRIFAFLLRLRREQKFAFFWTLTSFFCVVICLGQQMDDASLLYAACVLLSSSPVWKKLLGCSSREVVKRASLMFQPPMTEEAELAEYMPNIPEGSNELSLMIRRNSHDSTATDHDMELSVFAPDREGLGSLETSQMSMLNESQFDPLMERSRLSSHSHTEDDSSPIPSDVEVIDSDDIPFDFPSVVSIQSGILDTGSYSVTGTLTRHPKSSKVDLMD